MVASIYAVAEDTSLEPKRYSNAASASTTAAATSSARPAAMSSLTMNAIERDLYIHIFFHFFTNYCDFFLFNFVGSIRKGKFTEFFVVISCCFKRYRGRFYATIDAISH